MLTLNSNNITLVPKSFADISANVTLSMVNNPSECFKVLDRELKASRIICDCAKGYVGINSCTSVEEFLQLPAVASQSSGLHLESTLLNNSEYSVAFGYPDVGSALGDVQDPQLNIFAFEVPLLDGSTYNVSLPSVFSVFGWTLGEGFPQPALSTLQAAMWSPTLLLPTYKDPKVLLNPNTPTSLAFTCDPPLPSGLSMKPITGEVAGKPEVASPPTVYYVTATDEFTQESLVVATFTLSVVDCGPDTCLNGGVCGSLGNEYSSEFSCDCKNNTAGPRCERLERVVENSNGSFWTVGPIVLVSLLAVAVLCGLVVLAWLGRRHKANSQPVDFEAQMKAMIAQGLIKDHGAANRKLIQPREIKRARIKLSEDKIGSGAFGSVYKV